MLVKYVGHAVLQEGISRDLDKITAVVMWPKPKNFRELKKFLGFAGYCRQFVWDYARLAKPLNNLT